VLLALWLLADRWGRATPDGTVLSLALTHELLGQLTGARRSPAADRLGEGAGNARQGLRCAPLETSRVRTGR